MVSCYLSKDVIQELHDLLPDPVHQTHLLCFQLTTVVVSGVTPHQGEQGGIAGESVHVS